MKECPKCGTLYTDATLAYCLSDGTPLVVQNSGEKTEQSSNADIVTEQFSQPTIDSNTKDETIERTKLTNLPTEETVVRTNQTVERKGVSPFWILATFGLLAIILLGGIFLWMFTFELFGTEDASNKINSNTNLPSVDSQKNTNENKTENPNTSTTQTPTSTPRRTPTPKPTQTATPKSKTYRVVNVKSHDVLYIRPHAGNLKVVVGKIPPNGKGIKIVGGSKKVGKSRWVLIRYNGKKGWVNSKFIRKE